MRERYGIRMKKKGICIFAALCVLVLCPGCSEQESEKPQIVLVQEDEEEPFAVVTADYGTITESVSVSCIYTATEEVDLSFPVSDELITKIYVNQGDFVSKGDMLAVLEVEELEQEIAEQQYKVDSLQLKLEQTREIYEFDLSSAETLYQYTAKTDKDKENLADKKKAIDKQYKNTLEDLEDSLTIENMRLTKCRKELEEGQIYAPMDGVVTYVKKKLQDSFSIENETVMTICGLDSYYFIAENANYLEYFEQGKEFDISYRENSEDKMSRAVVERRDEEAGKVYLKLLTDEMPESDTKGSIYLQLAQKENVLCIPASALHESDKGFFVYLYQDGLLEMRYVTVGLEGEAVVEITKGLTQGDAVVLD